MLTGFLVVIFFLIVSIILNLFVLNKVGKMNSNQFDTRLDNFEKGIEKIERNVTEQISKNREEIALSEREARIENARSLKEFGEMVLNRVNENAVFQKNQLDFFSTSLNTSLKIFNESISQNLGGMSESQKENLKNFSQELSKLTASNEQKFEGFRSIIEAKLTQIQDDNTKKLSEMRQEVGIQTC